MRRQTQPRTIGGLAKTSREAKECGRACSGVYYAHISFPKDRTGRERSRACSGVYYAHTSFPKDRTGHERYFCGNIEVNNAVRP